MSLRLPDEAAFRATRRVDRRGKHGLSAHELDLLVQSQRYRCASCGDGLPDTGWHVDHDHALAATHHHPVTQGCRYCVRGIVCRACNLMLGEARDEPERLQKAIDYLKRWARELADRNDAWGQ